MKPGRTPKRTPGRTPQRTPQEVSEANVAFIVIALLAVLGFVGSVLAVGPTESFGKTALFLMIGAGSAMSFYGLNAFHRRRVALTGDPRTTLYSAFAIWSALSMTVLSASLVLILIGRFAGFFTEESASHVAYYFVTWVALVTLAFGAVCYADTRHRGLLSRKVYLWPWSRFWARRTER